MGSELLINRSRHVYIVFIVGGGSFKGTVLREGLNVYRVAWSRVGGREQGESLVVSEIRVASSETNKKEEVTVAGGWA